jgi:hypothetical protein
MKTFFEKRLAGAFWLFSMSRSKYPFSHSGLPKRLTRVALRIKSPTLRVWLPSQWCQPPSTRGSLFQLPTLLSFALQSFPPPRGSRMTFPSPAPLWLFATKPARLDIGAPAVSSPRRSRAPSCFPNGLGRGGASALLGLPTSRALPLPIPTEKHLSSRCPSRPSDDINLTILPSRNPKGLRHCELGSLPP